MTFYDFGKAVCNFFVSIYFNIEYKGIENVPLEKKGLILISNHQSYSDPILMGIKIKKRQLKFMAKDELFHIPLFSLIIRKLGAFPVKRGIESKKAIEIAKQTIMDNNILGLFPEGHRSKTGELLKPKSGVVLIAAQTKAPIIPISIYFKGKYPRAKVKVYYGELIDTNTFNLPHNPPAKLLKEATKQIWSKVEELNRIEKEE